MFEVRELHSESGDFTIGVLIDGGRPHSLSVKVGNLYLDQPSWIRGVLMPALFDYTTTETVRPQLEQLWTDEPNFPRGIGQLRELHSMLEVAELFGWMREDN